MPANSPAVLARAQTIGASGPGGTGPAGRIAAHCGESAQQDGSLDQATGTAGTKRTQRIAKSRERLRVARRG
jgi:hypothetical protein